MEQTHRILVVDDDAAIRDVVAEVLEDEGYQVEKAASGAEALVAIETQKPDLVVLDMRMPVMNGWEFAEELAGRRDNAVPILVMTAAVDAAQRAQEIGAAGTLSKPFDLVALLEMVEGLLSEPTR